MYCTAATHVGNYRIDITNDVLTLCPQQIVSIDNVTFSSPNAVKQPFTEIVDVFGHEGHPGYIIVRDAPDQEFSDVQVSFVSPTLALYGKTASTGVVGGAP